MIFTRTCFRNTSIFLAFFFLFSFNIKAQTNEWTWVAGNNTANSAGSYGTINVSLPSNQPPAREGSASWTDANGNFWLFGGQNSSSQMNDLWEFNTSTGDWTWRGGVQAGSSALGVYGTQGIASASNYPGTRYLMAYTSDANGNLWLFGGQGESSNWSSYGILNDLWEFSPSTMKWTWWGGSNLANPTNNYGSLGAFSTTYYPSGRIYSDMWVDSSNHVWIFGGFQDGWSNPANDMWQFNPSNLTWGWVSGSTASNVIPTYTSTIPANINPGSVVNTAAWKDQNGIFWIFGGEISYEPTNALWSYNPASNLWTYENSGKPSWSDFGTWGTKGVFAEANRPAPFYQMSAIADSLGNVWLMGGYGYNLSGNTNYLNALWAYDPDLNQWAWMGGSSTVENNTGIYGTKGTAAPNNVPGARELPNLFAQSNSDIWVFGGYGYDSKGTLGYLNDLWYISPTSLVSTNTPVISPASGTYGSPLPVTITDSTSGAVIYYTTNGSVPTTASSVYSNPISLSSSAKVCAMAIASGKIQSAVTCNTYTIITPVYTWAPPTTIVYGNNLATVLTASANIPGTWAYDATGYPSVTASTVLPVAVYQIDAVFTPTGGGATHKISNRFTVTPASLAVQPTSLSVVYDSQVASYAYSISGLVNGDSSSAYSGVPTITTTATVRASSTPGIVYYTSNVGTYTIYTTWGSLKSANYTFVFKTAALTITPSTTYLTIQPNNITVKQGLAIPTLTYTVKGLLNWDTAAGELSGTPTLSTTAIKGSPKGTYPITSAAGTLKQLYGNYSGITYASGTLTIN